MSDQKLQCTSQCSAIWRNRRQDWWFPKGGRNFQKHWVLLLNQHWIS